MTIYTPEIITDSNRLQMIDTAYRRAGINPPNRAVPFAELVNNTPKIDDVAYDIALTAHESDPDVAVQYEQAIEKVKNAIAADTLRQAYSQAHGAVTRDTMADTADRAAKALSPVIARTVDGLAKAAAKLDATDPLSVDRAVDTDTTKELKTTRTALADLAVYAGIHPVRVGGAVPSNGIAKALHLLALPECVEEEYTGGALRDEITNADKTEGTRTVRRLDADLRHDPDVALINVARGQYEGVTISLATSEQVADRWRAVQRAFTKRRVNASTGMVMR